MLHNEKNEIILDCKLNRRHKPIVSIPARKPFTLGLEASARDLLTLHENEQYLNGAIMNMFFGLASYEASNSLSLAVLTSDTVEQVFRRKLDDMMKRAKDLNVSLMTVISSSLDMDPL